MKALATLPFLALALTACGPSQQAAQKGFDDQLAAAKSEGIPTSADEMAALIPQVNEAENAALIYTNIHADKVFGGSDKAVVTAFNSARSPQHFSKLDTSRMLRRASDGLALLESATTKSGCNFNRDWSLGNAVLVPEYVDLKNGSQLLVIRSAAFSVAGNHKAAVEDIARITVMANHVATEPLPVSSVAAAYLQENAAKQAAHMAIAYPNEPAYLQALEQTIQNWAPTDPLQEFKNEFYTIAVALENADNKEFLVDKMGVPEEDLKKLTNGSAAAQLQAKAKVIQKYRDKVAAYALPQKEADPKLEAADVELALEFKKAFPAMGGLFLSLQSGDHTVSNRYAGPVNKLIFTAAMRAIKARSANGTFPKSLDVSDLVIPFDNIPLQYESDGQTFTITAPIPGESSYGNPNRIQRIFPDLRKL